jgi:hypothetical protein
MSENPFLEASKEELAVILAIVDFKPLASIELDLINDWIDNGHLSVEGFRMSAEDVIKWLGE